MTPRARHYRLADATTGEELAAADLGMDAASYLDAVSACLDRPAGPTEATTIDTRGGMRTVRAI